MKKRILMAALLPLLLAGCAGTTTTPVQAPEVKLANKVAARMGNNDPALLSALVVMAKAGAIREYRWTPPTTGAPVAKYRAWVSADSPDTSLYVLFVGIDSLTVEARGVDAAGRRGEMSPVSVPLVR